MFLLTVIFNWVRHVLELYYSFFYFFSNFISSLNSLIPQTVSVNVSIEIQTIEALKIFHTRSLDRCLILSILATSVMAFERVLAFYFCASHDMAGKSTNYN